MKSKSTSSRIKKQPRRRKNRSRQKPNRRSGDRLATGYECSIRILRVVDGKSRQIETVNRSIILHRRTMKSSESITAKAVNKLVHKVDTGSMAAILDSLGNSHRLAIVHRLLQGSAGYKELQKTTGLKAGPLYHHIAALRLTGVLGPKNRDIYELTESGQRLTLLTVSIPKLLRSGVKHSSKK